MAWPGGQAPQGVLPKAGALPPASRTALFFKGNFFPDTAVLCRREPRGEHVPLSQKRVARQGFPHSGPSTKRRSGSCFPNRQSAAAERGGPALTSKIPARQGRLRPKGPLDNWRKNAYNHKDFTAMTPQQYSMRRSQERDPLAGRVPSGQEEGQRRSGGGNAHGPLPVPGG